jgi:uncharacterized GH25 family protein
VGLELEIVPDQDPTRLTAGAELPVRILHQGAPVPGFAVGAQRERETEISFAQTDDSGRALIKLAKPGRWLLSGTLLRRSRDAAREWDSDFTTLTLTVAPRGP